MKRAVVVAVLTFLAAVYAFACKSGGPPPDRPHVGAGAGGSSYWNPGVDRLNYRTGVAGTVTIPAGFFVVKIWAHAGTDGGAGSVAITPTGPREFVLCSAWDAGPDPYDGHYDAGPDLFDANFYCPAYDAGPDPYDGKAPPDADAAGYDAGPDLYDGANPCDAGPDPYDASGPPDLYDGAPNPALCRDAGAAIIIPAGSFFDLSVPVLVGGFDELGDGTVLVFTGTDSYEVTLRQYHP